MSGTCHTVEAMGAIGVLRLIVYYYTVEHVYLSVPDTGLVYQTLHDEHGMMEMVHGVPLSCN
jgi:hypothetical protein